MKHVTLKSLAAAAMLVGLVGTANAATFRLTTETTVSYMGVSWGPLDITFKMGDNEQMWGRSSTRLTSYASPENVDPIFNNDVIDVSLSDGTTTIVKSLSFDTLYRSKIDENGSGDQLGYLGRMKVLAPVAFDFGYGVFTLNRLRGGARSDTPYAASTPDAPFSSTSTIRGRGVFDVTPVPLPASGAALLLGLVGFGALRRRAAKKA